MTDQRAKAYMRQKHPLMFQVGKAVVLICALWTTLVGVATYKAHATKVKAEHFLANLRHLEVGNSTMQDVREPADEYGGKWHRGLTSHDVPPCGSGASVVDFVFENLWMHWLVRAPLTRFSATIYLKDDLMCFRTAGIFDTAGGFAGFDVQEFRESPLPGSFRLHLNPFKTIITMTVAATPSQRMAAYSINLDCLTKLRGCRDTREMAPEVWQNSREVAPGDWVSQWGD